ncbi:TauD/TfdA family dioxygenase [Plantactinospora solaniradicis]|uniref:TauD/TfdA family dioxygenase n=1 Tax=Plantactinospora solaniradicis TaxID=1723736 RepID=A0ABW1KPA9_9ACTN
MTAWHVAVTPREARDLTRLAAHLTANPTEDPESFCRDAKRAARQLPNRIAEALQDYRRWGSVSGMLVFSGLPVGPLPPTPVDNTSHLGERTLLARIQALFNEFLGHMLAYEAEGAGRLFQDMVPARTGATSQTSLSSSVELELHTEQAFSQLRPDYLSLACLRGDPGAQTYLMTAADLAARLDHAELALLREPRWTTGVDESFRMGGQRFVHGDVRGPMPIMSGSDDDPFIVLDQDLMHGIDPVAQQLLTRVIALYPILRHSHVLDAGEIMVLDNARVVHGRSPFRPRFDGTDRFVVRSFVTHDLARTRHARRGDSRMVAAQYS